MYESKEDFENIYNEFRTCEMNKEYYAERISKVRSRLRYIDIFVAIFGGTAAITSWSLWNVTILGAQVGAIMFGMFVGVAVLLTIAKPYLKFEDEIERLSGMQSTYAALAFRLKDIVDEVRSKRKINDENISTIRTLKNVRSTIITREDQPSDRNLIDKMMDRVNERYPLTYFYYPPNTQ